MKAKKAGLDTGFFVKLFRNNPLAEKIYEEILGGELVGVVCVITLFELKKLALKGVLDREAYELLERSWKILFQVEPVTAELALEAAALSHGTGLPAADALIYTTCRRAGCTEFYTTDSDFEAVSDKRMRIIRL